ncbi:hypothetical protein PAHAL_8G042800 [Panicum hallii]|uniref:Uncharacterized protein n=1 Tax=Panicum hallii TaxID=206008 RepID=A0A2T8I7L9_9POAL|nr:hypothetical protein PAHAL_8G042800 [Panicum hallii]
MPKFGIMHTMTSHSVTKLVLLCFSCFFSYLFLLPSFGCIAKKGLALEWLLISLP